MVFSHGSQRDKVPFAFVAGAADIYVCGYNMREDERQEGDHAITRRREHFATSQIFIYRTAG